MTNAEVHIIIGNMTDNKKHSLYNYDLEGFVQK